MFTVETDPHRMVTTQNSAQDKDTHTEKYKHTHTEKTSIPAVLT